MSPAKRAELTELVHAACDGTLTAAQVGRLEELLRGDAEAQALYLRHAHLQAALRWDLGAAAEYTALRQLRERPPTRRRRLWPALAAAAALLLAAAGLWYGFRPAATPHPATAPLAVLAQAVAAEWDGPAPAVGESLAEGTLRLRTGLARIEFASGVSVTLEGPAAFTIHSADRAALHHGQLTARVPPEAIGFRVDTPALQVVDLGTSFGVVVEAGGAAEVCVFEGEVEVATSDLAEPQRLQEGSAARAEPGQDAIERTRYDVGRFERAWPVSFGVVHADGVVRFVRPGPRPPPRRFADDDHLIVFPERERVVLRQDVTVTTDTPGYYKGPFEKGRSAVVPAGTAVRSYLLQFVPKTRAPEAVRRLRGSITLDRPILAVVATSAQLAATDGVLGAEGSRPLERPRGIEEGDSFTISDDRHTLTLDWTASTGIDQLRILAGPARE
jgi:ferric-dicitrate binding protein FerR (iron transport regulator)